MESNGEGKMANFQKFKSLMGVSICPFKYLSLILTLGIRKKVIDQLVKLGQPNL